MNPTEAILNGLSSIKNWMSSVRDWWPSSQNIGFQIVINGIAALGSSLLLKYSGLLTDSSAFTPAKFGVASVVLFTVMVFVTAISSFRREDVKYLLTLSMIVAVVSLYQWTYSFPNVVTEPWSVFAAQLPVLGLIIACLCTLKMWTNSKLIL